MIIKIILEPKNINLYQIMNIKERTKLVMIYLKKAANKAI